MNKIKKAIFGVAVVAMLGVVGCSNIQASSYVYENGDKYTAGDREITDKIEKIDIDYISGDITLSETDSDKVSIKETSKVQLDDKRKVHTWVDGSTLYIRFAESGKGMDFNDLDKKLIIDIPKGTELNELKVELSSGDIGATCSSKNVDIHASSGDMIINLLGESESVNMETSSGGITLDAKKVDKVKLSSSSGSKTISLEEVADITSEASSGDGEFTFENVPETADIQSSSGNITVSIPKDSDLTANIQTSSGDIDTAHEFSKDGNDYVSGKGTNQMKIQASSGDVKILNLSE